MDNMAEETQAVDALLRKELPQNVYLKAKYELLNPFVWQGDYQEFFIDGNGVIRGSFAGNSGTYTYEINPSGQWWCPCPYAQSHSKLCKHCAHILLKIGNLELTRKVLEYE